MFGHDLMSSRPDEAADSTRFKSDDSPAAQADRQEKLNHERQVKLGLLVVQLGGATFNEVFPDGLRHRPELTCIIGKPKRPSWWSLLLNLFVRQQRVARPFEPVVVVDPIETGEVPVTEEVTPIVEEKPKGREGLPKLNFSPLPDSVVAILHPAVQRDRSELLSAEAVIHNELQRIEETRYKYLVPDVSMQRCQGEIQLVGRCYVEANRADAQRAKRNDAATDAQGSRRVLQCADLVKQLQVCAEREVEAFATSD